MGRYVAIILLVPFSFITGYAQRSITPKTALDAYIHNNDPTWGWENS